MARRIYGECITITPREYKETWNEQSPGAVFCNRCEDNHGRHGFDRHIRERAGGFCPCCRREYQKAYYQSKKSTGSGRDVTRLLYQIKRQREQMYIWYKAQNPEVLLTLKTVHIPELNRIERLIGQQETKLSDLNQRLLKEHPLEIETDAEMDEQIRRWNETDSQ
jgi:hypothetical protein